MNEENEHLETYEEREAFKRILAALIFNDKDLLRKDDAVDEDKKIS
jgi:hypothetical protein